VVFEFDGEKYQQASAHQKEWGAGLLREIAFTGSERLLDLGCGDGAITAQAAQRLPGGLALGIDSSEGMISTAKSTHNAANLEFRLLDINALDFEDKFDIVISNATLHWTKDHRRLLANTYKALRPGGFARFNFAAEGNCVNFFAVIEEAMKLPQYAPAFEDFEWPWYMPSIERYRSLAAEFPFVEQRVWGENADRFFPDAKAMTNWIDQPSLVPLLPYLEDGKRQKFRDYVVRRMIERTRQPDGTCFETFRRVNLYARK